MATDGQRRPMRVKLEELLLRHGIITPEQLQTAQEEQKKWGGDLGHALVDLGFISEDLLMRVFAHQVGISYSDPSVAYIPKEIIQAVPVQLCERYGFIPVGGDLKARVLKVATHDPGNADHLRAISAATGYKVEPVAALGTTIERGIRRHYYGDKGRSEPTPPPPVAEDMPRPRADSPAEGPTLGELLDGIGSQPAARSPGLPDTLPLRIELASLAARLDEVEAKLVSNPHFAGVLARLERLEQLAATEVQALRVIADVLVEHGLITREEYYRRIKQRS